MDHDDGITRVNPHTQHAVQSKVPPPRFMRPIEVWSKDASSYASFMLDFFPVLGPFARRAILLGRMIENMRVAPADPTDAEVLLWLEAAYPLDAWEWK